MSNSEKDVHIVRLARGLLAAVVDSRIVSRERTFQAAIIRTRYARPKVRLFVVGSGGRRFAKPLQKSRQTRPVVWRAKPSREDFLFSVFQRQGVSTSQVIFVLFTTRKSVSDTASERGSRPVPTCSVGLAHAHK
jgi:hypothetical protein